MHETLPTPRHRRKRRRLSKAALPAAFLSLCFFLGFFSGRAAFAPSPASETFTVAESPLPTPKNTFTVVLDAGHGGAQSGCEFEGILEKDITLAVTHKVKEKLEAAGIFVVLTRSEDTDLSLDRRARAPQEAGADLFLSIHCNSFAEDTSVSGFEGYYYASDAGRSLSDAILTAAKALGIRVRSTKEGDFQVLRENTVPAALLEIGFLSCPAEREMLTSDSYQNTVAEAIARGAESWLKQQ